MAVGYEVRPEYRDMSMEDLLESTVMCFQGVGETQHEILQRFFAANTVHELANMQFFLWALAVQELALRTKGNAQRTISELDEQETLKFKVRSEFSNLPVKELLIAPVRALDELTPSQALALYDGFRITTVMQLAQNRIMLEARIIEYLKMLQSGEIVEGDLNEEIASILLSGSQDAVKNLTAEDESDLTEMTDTLHSHLRERIESLKSHAQKKGEVFGTPSEESSEKRLGKAQQQRQGGVPDSRSRADMVRERRRLKSNATTRSASSGSTAPRPSSPASKRSSRPAAADKATVQTVPNTQTDVAAEDTPARRSWLSRPRVLIAAAILLLIGGGVWYWVSSMASPTGGESAPGSQGAEAGGAGAAGLTEMTDATDINDASANTPSDGPTATTQVTVGSLSLPLKTMHVVIRGQTLQRISQRHYDDPLLWRWIYQANQAKIEDPDIIYPDQEFAIPEVPE